MATRSAIAMMDGQTGKIRAVYCHWDEYPEYNGALLCEFYMEAEMVEKLISLGSISLLAERLEPNEGERHSFDKPAKGVVVAYHRDRGEGYVQPDEWPTEWRLVVETEFTYGAEFVYLFKDGDWWVYETQGSMYDESLWSKVEDVLRVHEA